MKRFASMATALFLLASCATREPFPVQPAEAPEWSDSGLHRDAAGQVDPEAAQDASPKSGAALPKYHVQVRRVSGEFRAIGDEFPVFFRLYWTLEILQDAGLLGDMRPSEVHALSEELFGTLPERAIEGAFQELQIQPFDLNGNPLLLQVQQYSLPAGVGRLQPRPSRLIYVVTNMPPGQTPQPRTTVSENVSPLDRRSYQLISFVDRPPMALRWWIDLDPSEQVSETQEAAWAETLGPHRNVLVSPVGQLSAPELDGLEPGSEDALLAVLYLLRIGALGTARDHLDKLPQGQALFVGLLLEGLELAAGTVGTQADDAAQPDEAASSEEE